MGGPPGNVTMSQQPSSRQPHNSTRSESHEQALLDSLVEKVVGAAYEVSNVLGAGSWRRSTSERSWRSSAFAGFQ